MLHKVDVPVLDLNFSTLVYVVEMKVSQAGVRTKFKVLDFQVIVQCVHALFSVNITRFEFVQRKTEKVRHQSTEVIL